MDQFNFDFADACSLNRTQPGHVCPVPIRTTLPTGVMAHRQLKRIGLFGGSFDPVHLGHLLVAHAAIEELNLDRLFVVPAARSPFKPDNAPSEALSRVQLLRLALAGHSNCEIDLQEIERGGVSYTIETVERYAAHYPNAEIHYLIGDDHVTTLSEWKASDRLASLTHFAVIPRPGSSHHELPGRFRGRHLSGWPLSVSSSDIRHRLRNGLPVDHLLPDAVAEAIRNNRLYL